MLWYCKFRTLSWLSPHPDYKEFRMSLFGFGAKSKGKPELAHVAVESVALGKRQAPLGRPLPDSSAVVGELEAYVKRAAAIDYQPDPMSILYEKLKIVIAKNNILVYDSKAVCEWMTKMARKEGPRMVWVWKSLTKPLNKLISDVAVRHDISYQHRFYDRDAQNSMGAVLQEARYTKVIPEAVLATAETILKHFDQKKEPVVLLVSDYEVAQPDPFLAAAVPGHPFLIVDFWDEPGFKPVPAKIDTQKGLEL